MVAPVLILGIGNILMRDDGVGVYVIRSLMSDARIPDYVEIYDGSTAGLDLIPVMENRQHIIIVDALRVDDKPGTIYRFGPDSLKAPAMSLSLHEFGIMQALHFLELGGERPYVDIIGIVPGDVETIGLDMSPSVAAAIDKAGDLIAEILNEECTAHEHR